MDSFTINGTGWIACEDLQQPDGAIVMVSTNGNVSWFPKSYSMYGNSSNDEDPKYYLNLTKKAVMSAHADILGIKMLSKNYTGITWDLVANAVPPIRSASGVRAFVGSRASVAGKDV
jgi:hypothetical protein